ncbi:hypothetical protein KY285_020537 [Solanum tuberosum]|nr:hypothetical protein KY285_020537 [Solanum tuberosum]
MLLSELLCSSLTSVLPEAKVSICKTDPSHGVSNAINQTACLPPFELLALSISSSPREISNQHVLDDRLQLNHNQNHMVLQTDFCHFYSLLLPKPSQVAPSMLLACLCFNWITRLCISTLRIINNLEGDRLEGFLTSSIGNLTELVSLNLGRNQFRGPVPESSTYLRKLTSLQLYENFFSSSLVNDIGVLTKLEILDVANNKLSGSIPSSTTSLRRNLPQLPSKIKTLSLSHNLLSGHITTVHKLRHLRTLGLSENRFSGGINKGIFMLPELSHVSISVNRFTVFEVVEFSDKESQLHMLDVNANRLHGHLPVNLDTYPNLTEINLGHNLFSGEIPSEYWSRLRFSWRNLNLEYNNLEGSVPRELNKTLEGVQGSFEHNCLICPKGFQLCHGQRTASECHGGDHN